jgi:hypothetical protein
VKARDVEKRLEAKLPLFTDRFTREIAITSIVPAGTVATATTASAHGLSIGSTTFVAGALAPVEIATLSRAETIATVTTATDHDLTENFFTEVLLSGFNESEFNGTFQLLTVPNRQTFTILVADSGAATGTGTPLLEEPGSPFGYNGKVVVTGTPTTTSFTYDLPQALTEPATGANLRLIRGARIHSAISIDRAHQVFEPKDLNNLVEGELSAFVILGTVAASRDRSSFNDGISSAGVTGDNRQQVLENVSIVVMQKVTKHTSAATARDDMQDISRYIIGVLAGWSPGSGFANQEGNKLRFISHEPFEYTTAIYTHIVEFQLAGSISNEDLQITPDNIAFRDIAFSFINDQGVQELSANVNLDDQPL